MKNFFLHSFLLFVLIYIFPSLAFVADFEKLSSPEKDKIFNFVIKYLSTKDIKQIKNAAYPYLIKDIQDNNNISLMHYAVDQGDTDMVSLLETQGSSVNQSNNAGITPLHIAIFNQNLAMVEFLISHGANTNTANNNGQTPLMIATKLKNEKIVNYLLNHRANINLQDTNGFNALIIAINTKNNTLAKLYIEKGININNKTKFGRTALHFAVQNENYEITKLLLEKGAKINLRDKDMIQPHTALDLLIKEQSPIQISNTNKNIEELLISYGAKKAKPYYSNNWSLSAVYAFASPFNEKTLGLETRTPVQFHYTGLNLRYYIMPDISLTWNFLYGFSQTHDNVKTLVLPGTLIGLQNLFSLLQTDYTSQLHGPAKGLYYTLLAFSAFLPEGMSWDIHLPTVPSMSFSIELDWAKVNYLQIAEKDLMISLSAEIQGRINFLLTEHTLLSTFLNVGVSYPNYAMTWGIGLSLGGLF